MIKGIETYWDVNYLAEYLILEHIERDFRVKKLPTFELIEDILMKNWTEIVSACSFDYMRIIISSKPMELDKPQKDMIKLQQEKTPLKKWLIVLIWIHS